MSSVTATPRDVADYIKKRYGDTSAEFRAACLADPAKMRGFGRHISQNVLREDGFGELFAFKTFLTLDTGDYDAWGAELARILLGQEPTPNFQ